MRGEIPRTEPDKHVPSERAKISHEGYEEFAQTAPGPLSHNRNLAAIVSPL